MKKNSIVLIVLMMISTGIFAQRRADGKGRTDRFSDYMKKELSLTDDQYAKVKTINQTFGDRFRKLRRDSTLTKEARHNEMEKIRADHAAALKGTLTDKQYAQWTALRTDLAGKGNHAAHAEYMKQELSLNDEQYSKVQALDKAFGDRFRTVRKDSTLTRESSRAEIKKIREEKTAAMKGILTPEQYDKWISLKSKRSEGRHDNKRRKGTSALPEKSEG